MTEWETKNFILFLPWHDQYREDIDMRRRPSWQEERSADDYYNGYSRAGLQLRWEQAMEEDPETCPKCLKPTNKFVGECDHCGYDRYQ